MLHVTHTSAAATLGRMPRVSEHKLKTAARLVATGMTLKEIAARTGVSESTLRRHNITSAAPQRSQPATSLASTEPGLRLAQRVLADEICTLVHGPEATRQARAAAEILYGASPLAADRLDELRHVVPETVMEASTLDGAEPAVDVLVASGVCSSRSDARRMIAAGAIKINRQRVQAPSQDLDLIDGRYALVQRGRRHHHLVVVE